MSHRGGTFTQHSKEATTFTKTKTHRAMADVHYSINELRHHWPQTTK